MIGGIELALANNGIGFEQLLVLVLFALFAFLATRSIQIGAVVAMIFSFATFTWFYVAGYNYILPLVSGFVFLSIMTITLWIGASNRG